MRAKCYLFLLFCASILFSACQVHSIVDLDNPEFPDTLSVGALSGSLLRKYSIEDVIIRPRIEHGSSQTDYKIVVQCFSKTNTTAVSIKTVSVLINGKRTLCDGDVFVSGIWSTDWNFYQENRPYSIISFWSDYTVVLTSSEVEKTRVDVSIVILVKKDCGRISERIFCASFIPKKRSYLE